MTLWLHLGFLILEATALTAFWFIRYWSGYDAGRADAFKAQDEQVRTILQQYTLPEPTYCRLNAEAPVFPERN